MASKVKNCYNCQNRIPNREYLICSLCKEAFDLDCANVSIQRFNLMDKERKTQWNCSNCRKKEKNTNNYNDAPAVIKPDDNKKYDHTDRSEIEHNCESAVNITQRKKTPVNKENTTMSILEPHILNLIKAEIKSTIELSLKSSIDAILSKEFKAMKAELAALNDIKTSMEFFSSEYDRMKTELIDSKEKINDLTKQNSTLHRKLDDLSNRINIMEQHSRETNIEINGIPENKSENLETIVNQIFNTISVPAHKNNIVSLTRVRKMDDTNLRPRAVVVKLNNMRYRDEVLSAVTNFNKTNPTEKLHSGHLGFGGQKSPIFVSEHLAPYFKALHARTRAVAREKNYKFTWIRNGRIFVRKNDQLPAKQIKNYESLNNL